MTAPDPGAKEGVERTGKTLVFVACYNERDNIEPLVRAIFAAAPHVDLLVIDDSSPDGTWAALVALQYRHPRLACVQRPRKMGVGSAHKYALLYALREGYAALVTMDADFSHDPAAIPGLLARHAPGTFVIGSRYCAGGRCDYRGYRDVVSRLGNLISRRLLALDIHELTTFFRVIDVATIARLPLERLDNEGYGFGVQLIYFLHKSGVQLRETPIHFADRTQGRSKIPRMQILWSAVDLGRLALDRLSPRGPVRVEPPTEAACALCGDRTLARQNAARAQRPWSHAIRCSQKTTSPLAPTHICLRCGAEQRLRTD